MPTAVRGWTVAYFASWGAALAPVGGFCAQVLLKYAEPATGTDAWWVAGACAGAATGLCLAWGTREVAPLHRFLRVAAPVATLGGVGLAVWMFVAAARAQGSGMFAGFGEFLYGLLGCLFAWCGGLLWLAACSGRRIASRPQRRGGGSDDGPHCQVKNATGA